MSSVNATTSGRLAGPTISKSSEGGSTPTAMRATVMARSLRPNSISTTRPPNCATPFNEATQTAAAVASPAASSRGTSCTDTTPNTTPLRSEEHTSELQSQFHLVCRLLLEKKKKPQHKPTLPISTKSPGPQLRHCGPS